VNDILESYGVPIPTADQIKLVVRSDHAREVIGRVWATNKVFFADCIELENAGFDTKKLQEKVRRGDVDFDEFFSEFKRLVNA